VNIGTTCVPRYRGAAAASGVSVAVKPYIRQAAIGLPKPNEFIAAVLAELARRFGPMA
jgi:hypothetical protein